MTELTEFSFGGEIVWTPSPAYVKGSHLQRFMDRHSISNWDELHQRSIEDVAWFNNAMLAYLGIEFFSPYTQILDL
ncbi:MAG: AMP-dependent synthetase, partial [Anaerolineae bacterium]|nr:AMP-dependent synthetase [Anaerolineae bacterium]